MFLKQCNVAAVRAPRHIKHVSNQRNGTDDAINCNVREHPRDQDTRDAKRPCFADNIKGHQSGDGIADAGNEAD